MIRRRDTGRAGPGAAEPVRGRRRPPHGAPPPLLPAPATTWVSSTRRSRPRLSKRREGADLSDFVWYHAFELPDGRVLPGAWDLRGHETAYLGGVDVAGKRVLELGPATGYLTFYMERMGAEVVAFEAGFDVSIDMLPVKGARTPRSGCRVMQDTIDRNHDAWWYLHRTLGSSAKFVQGNIYDMPADLGPLRRHAGRRHPVAPARALGRPRTGGAADDRDHDRDRAAAGRLAAARVQHHALLPVGGAPPDQLVVDLPGRRRLHARRGSASAGPRRPCTPSATTWPTTWRATPSTSGCTPWSAGPVSLSRTGRPPQNRPGVPRPRSTTDGEELVVARDRAPATGSAGRRRPAPRAPSAARSAGSATRRSSTASNSG